MRFIRYLLKPSINALIAMVFTLTCVTSSVQAQNQQKGTGKTGDQSERPSENQKQDQEPDQGQKPRKQPSQSTPMTIKKVFGNLPGDQKAIWTSPFHLESRDSSWLVPMVSTAGLLIASDQRNMRFERSNSIAISRSGKVSNGGLIALSGVPALMYLWGKFHHSERPRETGLLAAEALMNSLIVDESLKFAFGRERPTITDGQGRFLTEHKDPSFPSDHAMLSWTAASVIAHEYPGVMTKILAYGTAAAVSMARVSGRNHFPSDVIAGAAMGWLIGRHTYNTHHNREMDDAQYGNFIREGRRFEAPQTGTTYVSIDSWVYPAFDRLVAMGYIGTAESGMRPWTRIECSRLVEEAGRSIDLTDATSGVTMIYLKLREEFAPEREGKVTQANTHIEEIYTRVGVLSGQPLTDDYHFAKTKINDFGRPFGQGANVITGGSIRTVVGPLAFYVRGEFQHAGMVPAFGIPTQQAIINLERLPFAPPQRTDSLDRLHFLDAYVSFNFHNNLISFGKQTLWLGPEADGPFLASNNAEPLPMLRISRISPFVLPWIFRLMGKTQFEIFLGELEGQQFVRFQDAVAPLHPHPFVDGQKISFKPTPNLEFGFGFTTVFSGPNFPLTLHNLLRSYSFGNSTPGQGNDPGDRRSAFDFSYRVPGLRNWLTIYGDSFTEDEFSPIAYPRRSAWSSGLYISHFPKLPQLDLRVEGGYTDLPNLGKMGFYYSNDRFLSGYTNFGQIIGNALGREGRGINVWSTYRFTANNSLQLHYRTQHVNPEFLQGGHLRDFDMNFTFVKMHNIVFSTSLQYDHWNFPLLSAIPKTDVSASVQVSFRPLQGWSPWKKK